MVVQLVIPVWFNPPVLDGMAPAKPKAASPAKGFFDSPDICGEREDEEGLKSDVIRCETQSSSETEPVVRLMMIIKYGKIQFGVKLMENVRGFFFSFHRELGHSVHC